MKQNESVYIWHDVEDRDPYFDLLDVFASFEDGSTADYYPPMTLYRQGLELHPQYVLENGLDFAHFKFVHNTRIVPVFTRRGRSADSALTRTLCLIYPCDTLKWLLH